jgi:hypothetical protein
MATPLGDLDLTDVDGELSCNGKGELALVLKQDSPHLNIEEGESGLAAAIDLTDWCGADRCCLRP